VTDPVDRLARLSIDWWALWHYHHRGPAAAVETLRNRGGAGTDTDGANYQWQAEDSGRQIQLSLDGGSSRPYLTRDALDRAAGRLTDTDWAQLAAIVEARLAAIHVAFPDHPKPHEIPTPEQAASIRRGRNDVAAAERQADQLVRRALARTVPPPGAQLGLFA
jgi:hypothetical protein